MLRHPLQGDLLILFFIERVSPVLQDLISEIDDPVVMISMGSPKTGFW
jgi:hypothetical protein